MKVLILQRLKSKTYRVALLGIVLTIIETNSQFIAGLLPGELAKFAILIWPVAMLTLSEVTTTALSAK